MGLWTRQGVGYTQASPPLFTQRQGQRAVGVSALAVPRTSDEAILPQASRDKLIGPMTSG